MCFSKAIKALFGVSASLTNSNFTHFPNRFLDFPNNYRSIHNSNELCMMGVRLA